MREDKASMADLPGWRHRRYGLFLQANLASVPSWAPIGLDASRYLDYLEDPDLSVEVAAHHQARWDHVTHAKEFLPLLHFSLFDPQQWVDLAVAAGMSHIVQVAKDTDGLCWWDAPDANFNVVSDGPNRDVVSEMAAACERSGLAFGTAFSVQVTSGQETGPDPQVAQITDLVNRLGSRYLLGVTTASEPIPQSVSETVADLHKTYPDLMLNDAWGTPNPERVTRLSSPPVTFSEHPWELLLGLGAGRGHNRVETAQHRLTPDQIVGLVTEVIAKGGHLMIAVGVGADGRIPEHHAVALRSAGSWITAHSDLVHESTPWGTWGTDDVRYLRTGLIDERGECLWVVDLARRGEFPALGSASGEVTSVMSDVGSVSSVSGHAPLLTWEQGPDGLRVHRNDRANQHFARRTHLRDADPSTIAVYRVWLRSVEPGEPGLFDPELFPAPSIDLTAMLAAAAPGSVVQLGDASYVGGGKVPEGLTVRGLGPHRTKIFVDPAHPLEIGSSTRVEFARLEPDPLAPIDLSSQGAPILTMSGTAAVLLGVKAGGIIHVTGTAHLLRSCELQGLLGTQVEHLTVSRSHLESRTARTGNGIELRGGSQHLIEGCEIHGYRSAITCTATGHTTVRGNAIADAVWGIRAINCESPHLIGNSIRTSTRAAEIDGGSGAVIDANAVSDGDSGSLIRNGATSAVVSGNHWQGCRIGLMLWGAGEVIHHSNAAVGLLEPEQALVVGP